MLGKTYYVLPNPENYKEYGKASWYGTKFHGQRTSSGELYDMAQVDCRASQPADPVVRPRHESRQPSHRDRSRHDRGPFHSERLIDLSYAAAVKLGFADQGTTRVMVELVDGTDQLPNVASSNEPAAARTPPAAALALVPPEPGVPGLGQIFLQAGAFMDAAGAERLRTDLTELTGSSVYVSGCRTIGTIAFESARLRR